MYRTLAILFAAGITLFLAFFSKPHFRDAANWPWVEELDSSGFVAARERNRTGEGQLADFGLGLATLAFSLAVAGVALGAHDWAAVRRLVTPSRKWVVVLLANVSLLALFYSEWLALVRDYLRQEYPPWADTMAIPMMWFIEGWKLVAPVLTLGLVVCLWRARLPAPLCGRPLAWWPWISAVVIASLIAIEVLFLFDAVRFGKVFAIPCHLALVYWLLCGRAATCSRHAAPLRAP